MSWLSKKNDATALPMQEQPTTVNQYAPSYAPVVAVCFACVVLAAPLLWMALEFMLSYIDAKNAGRNTAILLLGLPVLYLLSRCGGALIDKGGALWRDINQANRDADVRIAQITSGASNAPQNSNRAVYPDAAKAQAAIRALQVAYKFYYDKKRLYKGNDKRPWNRNAVLDYKIDGLKHVDADALKGWMQDEGFVTLDDQINLARYKHVSDAIRALNLFIAPPIVFNGNRPTEWQETTSLIEGVK